MLALVNWGGTFHSDTPGTFESDMDGTFKVSQSLNATGATLELVPEVRGVR